MDATFLVISLIVSVIFAVICYRMAMDRGRNGRCGPSSGSCSR